MAIFTVFFFLAMFVFVTRPLPRGECRCGPRPSLRRGLGNTTNVTTEEETTTQETTTVIPIALLNISEAAGILTEWVNPAHIPIPRTTPARKTKSCGSKLPLVFATYI